jgi:predicted transcriptional regulator
MAPSRRLTAFRIDDDLLEGLAKAAAEDDRPLSYVIRQAVKAWLDARQGAKKKTERKRAVTRKRP